MKKTLLPMFSIACLASGSIVWFGGPPVLKYVGAQSWPS
jgi:hypothetical protein